MKVILKVDIKNLGLKNDIVKVADGFAVNALIPQGKAVAATPWAIKKLEKEKEKHHQELKDEAKHWIKLKAEIESQQFQHYGISKEGILAKNISRKQILEVLNKQLSIKLNKKQLPNKYEFGMGMNFYPIELYPEINTIAHIEIKEKT